MAYNRAPTTYVKAVLPVDVNDEIDKLGGSLAFTKTQFLGILIQFGLKSWLRAYSPERILTVEEWRKILEAGKIDKEEM